MALCCLLLALAETFVDKLKARVSQTKDKVVSAIKEKGAFAPPLCPLASFVCLDGVCFAAALLLLCFCFALTILNAFPLPTCPRAFLCVCVSVCVSVCVCLCTGAGNESSGGYTRVEGDSHREMARAFQTNPTSGSSSGGSGGGGTSAPLRRGGSRGAVGGGVRGPGSYRSPEEAQAHHAETCDMST